MQVIRTTRPNTALLPQMFANSPALQGRYSGGTKAFFSNSPAQMPADPTALGAGSGPDIQRRMSAAFDRLQAEELVKDTATKVDSKTARTLGRLVLEFEQVNNNLRGMQKGIKEDIRQQKNLFNRKKKLKEKEEKELKSLKGAFFGFRSSIAGFSALVAGKELLEGDFQGALQPAVAAVTLMLPEIINITSSVILGGLGIKALSGGGRRGGAPAAGAGRAPRVRGGGRAGLALGLGAAALGFAGGALLPGNDSDARIAAARQQKVISAEDVDRFGVSIAKFDEVVQSMLPKGARNKDKNGGMGGGEFEKKKPDTGSPATPAKGGGGGGGATPRTPAVPGASANGTGRVDMSKIDMNDPEAVAFIATVRELEGTAGPGGYNTWFGGRTDMDLSKMTVSQVVAEQKRRLRTGEATYGPYTSAAVGAGQFMYPEETVAEMGLDPDKVFYTPDLQNRMILHQSLKRRGVDPTKPLTIEDMRILGKEWASFTPHYGQTSRTAGQSLRVYEDNLRKARQMQQQSSVRQPQIQAMTIPGKTQTMESGGASVTASSPLVYVPTDYPSNDRFASNLLLGAYSA